MVYQATGTVQGSQRVYMGSAEMHGASPQAACKRRRQSHLHPPAGFKQVAWLAGVDPCSLKLACLLPHLDFKDVLVEEARAAARCMAESTDVPVRGGPWCRLELRPSDLVELGHVQNCSSRAAVRAYAEATPRGSLYYHLHNLRYGSEAKPVPVSGLTPNFPTKRMSGKHRPGEKRPSGKHTSGVKRPSGNQRPGAKRMSGKSHTPGSQSSGACRRFCKLPEAKPRGRS